MLNEAVSSEDVENDPRFERFIDNNLPASKSIIFAELVGWFRVLVNAKAEVKSYEFTDEFADEFTQDMDEIIASLQKFKAAVIADPTLITKDAPTDDA